MDYEKEYKEALERAKRLYEQGTITESLSHILPELKESEDERIKHEIKVILANTYFSRFALDYTFADMINWLEKQQKPTDVEEPNFFDDFRKSDVEVDSNEDGLIAETIRYKKEQKPVDKVGPKFRNGQWIVWQDKCYKVNYNGCGYELVDQNGLNTSLLEYGTIDENAHLWTIQDAKDGDVLYTSSTASHEVFIFKGLSKEGNIECYCSYDSEDKYCDGKYHFIGKPTFMTHPATKEQCDLLFQKMKEAGYEWDTEKKELKKIEQNLAWSEEDVKALNRISTILVDASEVKNWWKKYRLIEKDEMIRLTDWLKSLKDRVKPQPKQEWSEEDESQLVSLENSLSDYLDYVREDNTLTKYQKKSTTENIISLNGWIKSLKQ